MFPSACSFIVLLFTVVHYVFRPTWPSSGVGYVSVCVQLYFVGFHSLSLRVSAYMAIFRCRLCFRLRVALFCWFSLSFTTCFGLHDHLQVLVMFPSACSFIVFWSSLSFTTRFGLHDHLHVLVLFPSACSFIVLVFTVFHYVFRSTWPSSCVGYFIFICLKDSASLQRSSLIVVVLHHWL
jgi:hypothetical protein